MKTIVNMTTGEITQRELTPEELAEIPIAPQPSVQEQIEALEQEYPVSVGNIREFIIGAMEAEAIRRGESLGITPESSIETLRGGNTGYRKLKELEEKIAELRSPIPLDEKKT